MTMPNSDLLHPASNVEPCDTRHLPEPTHHHLFRVPQSDQEIKSECNLYHLWSIPTPGLHLSAKMRERESIRDGHQEWCYCGTAQSPSTSTIPRMVLLWHGPISINEHYAKPTPSQISDSTMLQEVPIIHPRMELPPDHSHRKNQKQPTD